jgi:cytidine deaminase
MPNLLEEAREAARSAYCPYSHFPVGAAVETEDGGTYRGCNVENASYGLTICAERVAIFAAVADGKRPVTVAVTCVKGDPNEPETLMPCGACRQVMREFLQEDAVVEVDKVGNFTLGQLLPKAFHLQPPN